MGMSNSTSCNCLELVQSTSWSDMAMLRATGYGHEQLHQLQHCLELVQSRSWSDMAMLRATGYGHEQLHQLQHCLRAGSVKKLVRYGNVESYCS